MATKNANCRRRRVWCARQSVSSLDDVRRGMLEYRARAARDVHCRDASIKLHRSLRERCSVISSTISNGSWESRELLACRMNSGLSILTLHFLMLGCFGEMVVVHPSPILNKYSSKTTTLEQEAVLDGFITSNCY